MKIERERADDNRQPAISDERSRTAFARPSPGGGHRTTLYTCALLSVACCSLITAYCLLPATETKVKASDAQGASLLETGGPAAKPTPTPPLRSPVEVKLVTYNIRWRGGDDLQKLIEELRGDGEIGRADIIGLQEVDRNKKRTENVNTVRRMADALGMYYAWAAPPPEPDETEEPTGVAILSAYPLTEVERFVLPNEGPHERRRAAIGATIHFGDTPLRVYSIHAETRIKMEKKMEQLKAVLDDLPCHPKIKHLVVLGDFNTIKSKDINGARKLFTEAGFLTPFDDDDETFKTFIIELKLDWIWLRGLTPTEHGIVRRITLSDHWPLWLKARLDAPKDKAAAAKKQQEPRNPLPGQCVETKQ